MKKSMKFKRYDEGGEVADKEAGLKASKGEDVGFFQRLRMGNIDDPNSEAYKRFGAGRGRSERNPVNESVSVNEPMAVARPSMRTTADDMYSDYGVKAGRGSAGTGETVSPSARVIPTTSKPSATKTESKIQSAPKAPAYVQRYTEEMMEADNPSVKAEKAPAAKTKPAAEAPTKTSSSRVPTSEQASANRAAAMEKVKGMGSSIADYFSTYETPAERRNKEKKAAKGYASGGSVSSASRRADGIATKGKTRGKMC